jgi:hypothetical protein
VHLSLAIDVVPMQTLIYAGQIMENDELMSKYHVPPVCPLSGMGQQGIKNVSPFFHCFCECVEHRGASA